MAGFTHGTWARVTRLDRRASDELDDGLDQPASVRIHGGRSRDRGCGRGSATERLAAEPRWISRTPLARMTVLEVVRPPAGRRP